MAELDTQVAPWLQRNWAPRETFDPTPWLQAAFARKVEMAKLPLQIQGMALQNQAAQLAAQHQGMVNDMQGQQLQAYHEELPQYQQMLEETRGDPVSILNSTYAFRSPQLQQQYLQLKAGAAKTDAGLGHQEKLITDIQTAAAYQRAGVHVDWNPDGSISPQALEDAGQRFQAYQRSLWQSRTAWHYDPITGMPVQMETMQRRYPVDANGNPLPRAASGVAATDAVFAHWQEQLDMAKAAGDQAGAERAQQHIDFIMRQHPDPVLNARLSGLRKEKEDVNAQMLLYKPENPTYGRLHDRYMALQKEMDEVAGGGGASAPATNASAPARRKYNPATGKLE